MKKLLAVSLIVLVGVFMLSAFTLQAQDFCKGDFTYDGDVDSFDLEDFLNHFGRGFYYRPCPPDGPTPVPKTGQTILSITGDDGDLERGVALVTPRFTDNGNGTVTDNQTGLMWLKDSNCMGTNYPDFDNDNILGNGSVTWQHAFDFVAGINDGTYPDCGAGYTDWSVPNNKELLSLIHYGYTNPALCNTEGTGQWSEDNPFTNDAAGSWSSTTVGGNDDGTYIMLTEYGELIAVLKVGNFFRVWPVRGGH